MLTRKVFTFLSSLRTIYTKLSIFAYLLGRLSVFIYFLFRLIFFENFQKNKISIKIDYRLIGHKTLQNRGRLGARIRVLDL